METYVFRPLGQLALFGSAIGFAMLSILGSGGREVIPLGEPEHAPPTLNLSAAGDFQQAVHFNFDETRLDPYRIPEFVAPLHALQVSPQDWVRIYTNSPRGLPRSAHARIYLSARPERCFGNVMIGCVKVETARSSRAIPLHPEAPAQFGFEAPPAPGAYWIALQADWGFGATTQVFVIDVRA